MLRVSGVIALVLSCLLATLLFLRVQRLQRSGIERTFQNGILHLRLDTGPGTTIHQVGNYPESFPAEYIVDAGNRTVGLLFGMSAPLREIPPEVPMTVTHRWVSFRWLRWSFGSTEFESGGRIYVCERSRGAFLWSLGLIAAAPILCWLPFALGAFLLRKPPPPPLYGDDGLVEVRS